VNDNSEYIYCFSNLANPQQVLNPDHGFVAGSDSEYDEVKKEIKNDLEYDAASLFSAYAARMLGFDEKYDDENEERLVELAARNFPDEVHGTDGKDPEMDALSKKTMASLLKFYNEDAKKRICVLDPLVYGGKLNETKLKKALLNNITHFLLELGTGFAYVGREYRLQIGSTENVIDLLFYNLTLRCYVAIEVKIDMFDARDIGQLGTYVTAVNHILRDPEKDNPTIGLLVCKGKDNTLAQYALESSSQPLGISEYELQKLYPTKVEGTIPTIAEIESVAQDTVVKPEDEEK
jgi:predicted nuclease of restriction endonuclease-like (RecB) superfamily